MTKNVFRIILLLLAGCEGPTTSEGVIRYAPYWVPDAGASDAGPYDEGDPYDPPLMEIEEIVEGVICTTSCPTDFAPPDDGVDAGFDDEDAGS